MMVDKAVEEFEIYPDIIKSIPKLSLISVSVFNMI